MGEFLGFIMGWDLILEYIIGAASVGNALSQYINVFTGRGVRFARQVIYKKTGKVSTYR
jgi:amino acid transporter